MNKRTKVLLTPESQLDLTTRKIPTSKAPRICLLILLFCNSRLAAHQVDTDHADLQLAETYISILYSVGRWGVVLIDENNFAAHEKFRST